VLQLSNLDEICKLLNERKVQVPTYSDSAKSYVDRYKGRRGSMVVDVVASRQRRYDLYVIPKIVNLFDENSDGSLKFLADNPPEYLPLRAGEAKCMSQVAKILLAFGNIDSSLDEDAICQNWAWLPSIYDEGGPNEWVSKVYDINGIGPALLEYLRMRSGGDSLKVDVRVIEALGRAGVPVDSLTPKGVYEVSHLIATNLEISMLELDQLLWGR